MFALCAPPGRNDIWLLVVLLLLAALISLHSCDRWAASDYKTIASLNLNHSRP